MNRVPQSPWLERFAVFASVAAAVFGLAHGLSPMPGLTERLRDDAFYEFAWAANLAAGYGPSVSDGVATSGVQILWSLLLVPFAWVGGAASDLPPGAVPATVGFGARAGTLLLRFDGVVPPSDLVEAYVVLRRAQGTDAPAAPVLLEARRIEEPWDSRTLVASRAPRLGDVLTPTTRALPVSGDVVRIDVREIVAALAKKRVNDHGIGIVAEVREGTPLYVALVPARGALKGPELEIYAR